MIDTYIQTPWILSFILIILVMYLSIRLLKLSQATKKIDNKRKDISAQQALEMLLQGNNEYIQSGTSEFDRKSVADSQHPFAVILSCSDSRVSPELIFDQLHVGSLFIVRNAGNIVDDIVLGSIEYAVKYLEAPLIIVLGHERCGAITAAVQATLENHNECAAHIKNIINTIKPTSQAIVDEMNLTDLISNKERNEIIKKTAFANIQRVVQEISDRSPIISEALAPKKIKIIGAYYDLDYGNLEFID